MATGNKAPQPSAAQPTTEQLMARIAALESALTKQSDNITLKVSDKGGVSVYGLGRFPVTLYKEQWQRLETKMPEIKAFIAANNGKLKTKADAIVAAQTAPQNA